MQDLRAAPRWSKTAGIVVLVVFGLVLIVAVFGLLALTSHLDEQRQEELVKAQAEGKRLLGTVKGQIEAQLEGVVTRAQGLDESFDGLRWENRSNASQELQNFLEGQRHGALALWVLRVDDEGSLRWLGGRYVLWMRADGFRTRARTDDAEVDAQGVLVQQAQEARRRQGPLEALTHWATLATHHGLASRAVEGRLGSQRFPSGMGWALEMLKTAAGTLSLDADSLSPARVRDVILRAEEVRLLNRQRADLAPADYSQYERDLREASAVVLQSAPAAVRTSLGWELTRFRNVYAALARGERVSPRSQVFAARDIARQKAPRYITVVPQADSLFGVETRSPTHAVVVGLDTAGVGRLVDGRLSAHHAAFEALGMLAQAFPAGEVPVGPGGAVDIDFVDLTGAFSIPRRLAIFQVGHPRGSQDKYTSVLFWALILLAGAGLSVGGYVLIRLLTREIRLAQLKADFVSNLSHELKTPITSISLFTEMLEDGKLTTPTDQTEAFSVLGQESRRLQRIVDRMIDVARGEARSSPYTLEPGDLNRTVLEAATRFRRIITEPGLDLEIQLHPGRLAIQMDAQALDDVVTNLLSNAWKYKREDRARIAVRTVRRGRFAEIVVQDDGIGIPRAERRKVFDMFYRSEQLLTLPVAGTGLGLALVRSVVAGHKGRIRLDAAHGGPGSVFSVRLPLDRKAEEELARRPAPTSDASDAPPHGKVVAS